ncbi:ABC transporter ATP-binding protein [Vibrio sp. FNV 38]|nr:ABC transporter ATP-binding protein [Vibrio sp. FNV 38]
MCVEPIGIELTDSRLQYIDSTQPTLSQFNATFPAGQWTVILGRSGCGKTTLLRFLAGLLNEKVDWQGQLTTSDGKELSDRIAYMAQQDLLMPWLNVMDNVCLSERFASGTQSFDKSSLRAKATVLLQQVGLADHVHSMPAQLSGGMRQRVALARTLLQNKPLVLMDEPFSALDAVTRHKLQTLSAQLLQGKTVLLITHDPQEAVRLAQQLYVLRGTPASAERLDVPASQPPRVIDAKCADLQQKILDQLEADYE